MKRLFLILFLTLVCAVPIVQLPETSFFADTDSVEEALNQSAATDTLPECPQKIFCGRTAAAYSLAH